MGKEKKWKNADLIETFEMYARAYFGGKLRRPVRLVFAPIEGLGLTARYRTPGRRRNNKTDRFGIQISSQLRFSRRLWATTLLHEMVHLEQCNRYGCGVRGKRFNRRMKELATAGAFDGMW